MDFKYLTRHDTNHIESLFTSVFSNSEGADEGHLIGDLSKELALNIDDKEIFCFGAFKNQQLVGSIFFSKLFFKVEAIVFMLAPVAVSTEHQRMGIGQELINFGLQELRKINTDIAITYGDPAYYSKVGFEALSEDTIKAPLKLSMPEGWLGQSLTEKSIPIIKERPSCVKEFNNQSLW